ncbi:MAG TPA: hypothetical protein PLX89_08675 [Verrucomicrobiota bacterium]|nr:hypothetical protein [Verrucomicrobiota bacterium]
MKRAESEKTAEKGQCEKARDENSTRRETAEQRRAEEARGAEKGQSNETAKTSNDSGERTSRESQDATAKEKTEQEKKRSEQADARKQAETSQKQGNETGRKESDSDRNESVTNDRSASSNEAGETKKEEEKKKKNESQEKNTSEAKQQTREEGGPSKDPRDPGGKREVIYQTPERDSRQELHADPDDRGWFDNKVIHTHEAGVNDRPLMAEGWVRPDAFPDKRSWEESQVQAAGRGHDPEYVGGHLFARCLGAEPYRNIAPLTPELNQSMASHEKDLCNRARGGEQLYLQVFAHYDGASRSPSHIETRIWKWEDGQKKMVGSRVFGTIH